MAENQQDWIENRIKMFWQTKNVYADGISKNEKNEDAICKLSFN